VNKNIIIAVVILILLAAGGFLFLNKSGTSPLQNSRTATGTSQKSSLKALLGLGTNQKCSYSDQESGSSGTLYLGNGNARGDFLTTANGSEQGSHMIIDGQSMYVWTEGENQGFMMKRDAIEDIQENSAGNAPKTVDINEEVDYDCSSWSPDSSMFSAPSNVTFQDYSSIMQDASKLIESTKNADDTQDSSAACAACNNLPTDAQAQCKSALSCN